MLNILNAIYTKNPFIRSQQIETYHAGYVYGLFLNNLPPFCKLIEPGKCPFLNAASRPVSITKMLSYSTDISI
jgi:hypothetical protein